ncbi:MAG: HAD family hydrolase [Dermatophilaceae bacterium]
MPDYFRAIAVDFDGTLTARERPDPAVLSALAETRSQGRRLLLVTGRTLEHLSSGFPDVGDWFDAIVAENGALIRSPLGTRLLADPIDAALVEALERHGIGLGRGQVVLGCAAVHDHLALDEVHRLGADYQVRNRGALMPAGLDERGRVHQRSPMRSSCRCSCFFDVFALNQWLQCEQAGRWRDYLVGECTYLTLSLVAKSAPAWQVFAGTLAGCARRRPVSSPPPRPPALRWAA